MRIALDASALATPGNGIGRYLLQTLAHSLGASAGKHTWMLYGRQPNKAFASRREVQQRSDKMPPDAGRIAALATTLPVWCWKDRPELFWGPAHRLPVVLPRATARVVTVHDLCWRLAPETMRPATRWLDTALMPHSLKQADRIIAVSKATREDLCAMYPALADRVVVVHEAAARLPAPQPVETLAALGVTPPYVLFVGTQEPRKNLRRLLEAFAQVSTEIRGSTSLVVAGAEGWGPGITDTDVASLGLDERVRLLGRVDDIALATLYKHAVCLALPSLYEGFGLPLLEAMSQGTPVLTSHTSSMPEVAGEAGLLVDPLDVGSIAKGLTRLLSEPALRERLAVEAPQQAARFSWKRTAEETLRVFEDAVSARRAR